MVFSLFLLSLADSVSPSMCISKVPLLVYLTFFLYFNIQGQNYKDIGFTHLNAETGLSSDECNFVFQDSEGLIWIGTNEGLVRYDGYNYLSFETITNNPSYSKIIYNQAVEDYDRNIWFASSVGLIKYEKNGNKVEIIKTADFLGNRNLPIQISAIAFDPKHNRIWFGGFHGLYFFNINENKMEYFNSVDPKFDGLTNIRDIIFSRNGDIWVSTWGKGLSKYVEDDNTFRNFQIFGFGPTDDKYNIITSLFEDSRGVLWVGSWDNGLFLVDIEKDSPLILNHITRERNLKNSLVGNIIYDISEDKYGNIWVGTPYGLSIIKLDKDLEFINYVYKNDVKSLSNNEVKSIIKDQTGLMWLATTGGGVNKAEIDKNIFTPFKITEVDSVTKSQSVYSFIKDSSGRLLVGVQGLGFGEFDFENRRFIRYPDIEEYSALEPLLINTVKNFTIDFDGNIWFGTRFKGLIKYNTKTRNKIAFIGSTGGKGKSEVFRDVFKVTLDNENNLWALTDEGLFLFLQKPNNGFYDVDVNLVKPKWYGSSDFKDLQILDFSIDSKGKLFVLNKDGETFFSKESIYDSKNHINLELIPDRNFATASKIFFDSMDKLWVFTNDGIWIRNSKELTWKNILIEYSGLKISSIVEGGDGGFLISSNQGIIYLTEDGNEFSPNFYTSRNGLQGNVFINNAIFKMDNLVFVGGHNGFNRINLTSLKYDDAVSKVILTSIKTSKETIYHESLRDSDMPFIINYDDNMVNLTFSSLDLRDPSQIKYAYKMEGLEQNWNYVTANNRSATYVNLKPGKYQFRVKATNVSGVWSNEEFVFPIYKKTAPYLTWWAISLYVFIIFGLFFYVFQLYRKQLKAKQALKMEHLERTKYEKLNQFKLQFFTNISHELLTPLSILMIVSNAWKKNSKGRENKDAGIFERNVDKLNRHIKQILNFRKAETGNMQLNLVWFELNSAFQSMIDDYKILAGQRSILFNYEINETIEGWIDSEKLEICVNNLLSNAFKYTAKNGEVSLKVFQKEHEGTPYLVIEVKDSGKGIPQKALGKIFNRFYRLNIDKHFEDGLGIGLALTKNLVDIQNGEIKVYSELNKGSAFIMQIPLSSEYCQNQTEKIELDSDEIQFIDTDELLNLDLKLGFTEKTILLVEDNVDFLTLMENHLSRYFKIITCSNGKKGIELANRHEISLVVSDVSMPDIDGFEFCEKMKQDVNTSHIPFVLLTARTNDKNRLIGYKCGADSYLTKPIDLDVLTYRIYSLLQGMEKIHNEFNTGAFLEPEKIASTSIDEEFLKKAKEIVEQNISDTDFNVKNLYEELAMSNSMLYRKVKGILNLTPNEFIKNIRLRRAAQLLEDKEIQISEVAFLTGFNDLSYFGVCFKKQYGVTPKNYQNEKGGITID